jgi:hypothetical protein
MFVVILLPEAPTRLTGRPLGLRMEKGWWKGTAMGKLETIGFPNGWENVNCKFHQSKLDRFAVEPSSQV